MKKRFICYFICFVIIFINATSTVFADLVPFECTNLNNPVPDYCMYGSYKGPLYPKMFSFNPIAALAINLLLVFTVTALSEKIVTRKISKKSVILSLFLTFMGLIADSISLVGAGMVHEYYYNRFLFNTDFLVHAFQTALFIISVILLFIIYFISFRLAFKGKKLQTIISALLLAIINNPYWFVVLPIFYR